MILQCAEALLRGDLQGRQRGCLSSVGTGPPSDALCSGSWLHTVNSIVMGDQKVPAMCVVIWHYNTILHVQWVFFVFAHCKTEARWKSCIFHRPAAPPCSTSVDVFETGNEPILFSVPQMQSLGIKFELDPKDVKSTWPVFDLYFHPTEYSTIGFNSTSFCVSVNIARAICSSDETCNALSIIM